MQTTSYSDLDVTAVTDRGMLSLLGPPTYMDIYKRNNPCLLGTDPNRETLYS